ncbi:response regulator [Phenylobacterium sp.]|uniref:response regulator n=1 Tax=Phenylobacterium sp. TaxID=1871053 RepID=UPI00120A40BC|nr:response regulator [Phenylobacterium sp.]THD53122.1 MAG: response regulator [Phenylobacterium sp.]
MPIVPPPTRSELRSWRPNKDIDMANDAEVSTWAARLYITPDELREIVEEIGDRARLAPAKILLIAEDQVLLAMVLKDELEDSGYRVLELAIRHQEALGFARRVKPDLALVNIDLAAGDDGVALACDLKALGVPVLFISGQQDRARLASDVAIASLRKPYSPADMVNAVDYLFRHERGDESRPPPSHLEMFDAISPI